MAKIVGFGGCFFKCESPMALSAWYHRCLNMPIEREGGASLPITQLPTQGFQVWGPFRQDADYFEPGRKDFMLNLIVDDIEGAMAQIKEGGGEQVGDIVTEDFGRFGWFLDPEGNKVELREPPEKDKGNGAA